MDEPMNWQESQDEAAACRQMEYDQEQHRLEQLREEREKDEDKVSHKP